MFTRSGEWPPDATGCDLIVNATPVRDELLVQPVAGQTVVDLAYGPDETALVAAARAAGCAVVDGREALVRQGAASFRALDGARAARRGDAGRGQDLAHSAAPAASAAADRGDDERRLDPRPPVVADGRDRRGMRRARRAVGVDRPARARRIGVPEELVVLVCAREHERRANRLLAAARARRRA